MVAYLLLLVAVLSRVLPHAGWWNFTAVTGGLLYFGARRPWREMFVPLAALIATDCFLTISVYHYSFRWQGYVITWVWYLAAMALGSILLRKRTTFARGAAGALLGPTSFFLVSNYGVWASGFNAYPHTLAGLGACLSGRRALLPQRSRLDCDCSRRGARSARAGAQTPPAACRRRAQSSLNSKSTSITNLRFSSIDSRVSRARAL